MVATLEADPGERHPLVAGVDGRAVAGCRSRRSGGSGGEFELKPHLADTFKLSTDPLFVEKVVDVVGLYLNPPERAVVLCVDEKSQIQALDRSQPVLPMMPGMPERRTHDYVRNGITSLFAAFDIATAQVISSTAPPAPGHRVQEVPRPRSTRTVPADLDVHLVCDNYGTHKTPDDQDLAGPPPRFHMHFTPTGSSWINQVERWFGYLTDQLIRRGVHNSVQALEADIRAWIDDWNAQPQAVRLDQDRRRDPRIPRTILSTNLRRRTLAAETSGAWAGR